MIEDSKVVSRSSKTKKEGQYNDQKKKRTTMTLHNHRKSKQQGPYITQRLNSGDPHW
jgi:hypothetical protein